MPRPTCCRRIAGEPVVPIFKPAGVPAPRLDEVVLLLDEFEAVRLADLEGLYQEEAAARMSVSRPTFSRIIESAHRKIASALVAGKALRIEGGAVRAESRPAFRCPHCQHECRRRAVCPHCRGALERGDAGPRPRHGRDSRPGKEFSR